MSGPISSHFHLLPISGPLVYCLLFAGNVQFGGDADRGQQSLEAALPAGL